MWLPVTLQIEVFLGAKNELVKYGTYLAEAS